MIPWIKAYLYWGLALLLKGWSTWVGSLSSTLRYKLLPALERQSRRSYKQASWLMAWAVRHYEIPDISDADLREASRAHGLARHMSYRERRDWQRQLAETL